MKTKVITLDPMAAGIGFQEMTDFVSAHDDPKISIVGKNKKTRKMQRLVMRLPKPNSPLFSKFKPPPKKSK